MQNKAAGTATTSGLLYDLTAGALVAATSGSTRDTIAGVMNQTVTVAEALTQALVIDLSRDDIWLVDSTNASNVAHNGQAMVLSSAGVVNNTGTTSATGVVEQVGTFGATSDNKILVRFITIA